MVTQLVDLDKIIVERDNIFVGKRAILNFSSDFNVADSGGKIHISLPPSGVNAYNEVRDGLGNTAVAVGLAPLTFISPNNTIDILVENDVPGVGDRISFSVKDNSSVQKCIFATNISSAVRKRLDFVDGTGIHIILQDDDANDKGIVTIEQVPRTVHQRIEIKVNNIGVLPAEPTVNFLTGAGITMSLTNLPPVEKYDVFIDWASSGTASQIAFFTAPKIVSSDVNLFWDNNNKRLGVRTSLPEFAIDVNGPLQLRNTSGVGTASTNNCVLFTRFVAGPPDKVQLVAKFHNGNEVVVAETVV